MAALEEVAKEVLPDSMTYSWHGMSYQETKASGSVFTIFAFIVLCILDFSGTI